MKEDKKNYKLLILVGIVLLIFVPIITDYINKQKIQVISTTTLKDKLLSKESLIVFNGEVSGKEKQSLIKLRDKELENISIKYSLYAINNDEYTDKVYMYIDGDLQKSYEKFDYNELNKDIDVFLIGKNIDDNKSYKVASGFTEYKKTINSDKVVMSVFGRNSCSWCNKFKPVYNALAYKYDIDIYYFDSDSYDEKDYKKIINIGLTIPSKCSSDGQEFKLSDGFGTPLTIFTKNGDVVDCLSGYVARASLVEKLKSNGMISE